MKFKIDENLPSELAALLTAVGHEADTVFTEGITGVGGALLLERCRADGRILITLDLDFANVQVYPPKSHPGIIVLRSKAQDKPTVLALFNRVLRIFAEKEPKQQLWIVENDRIRYRDS